MKYLSLLLLFIGCKSPGSKQVNVNPKDLIGKTIEYRYGESIYHVTFDSDSTMHWKAMAGDEKGAYENEVYFMESIGENKIFITWDEANGIGVAQVLDFNEGKVYNHLLQDRKLRNGYGEIRILP
ncbi:MAG: MoaF-related domain-containing protein [Bacteroidota bacterium]